MTGANYIQEEVGWIVVRWAGHLRTTGIAELFEICPKLEKTGAGQGTTGTRTEKGVCQPKDDLL